MSSATEYNETLQRLIDRCEQASYRLERSNILPDLEGMEDDINTICLEIQAAPPEIAKQTEAKMARLIERLEVLATHLNRFKNLMQGNQTDGT